MERREYERERAPYRYDEEQARSGREAERGYDYERGRQQGPGEFGYGAGRQGFSGGRPGAFPEGFMTPGPFTGRGPRGYQRSDERIYEEVCELLTQHPHLDASDIEVGVRKGEVTLQGTVDSRRTRRLAEEVAESASGVKDVHNELRVTQPHPGQQRVTPTQHQDLPRATPAQPPEQTRATQAQQSGPALAAATQAAEPQRQTQAQQPSQSRLTAAQPSEQARTTQGQNLGQSRATPAQPPEQTRATQAQQPGPALGTATHVGEQQRPLGREATAIDRSQVREGMGVFGIDGDEVGRVKEVRPTDFLVDRPMQRDVYVPFDSIQNIAAGRIVLNVRAGQVGDMGWTNPPLMG